MTVKKYYIKRDGIEYTLHGFKFNKQGNRAIDTTKLMLSRTQDSIFDIGDDVSIGYHDAGDSFVADFNGDVVKKGSSEELVLDVESYAGRIFRTDYITEVHEDKTLEWIVEFLITNYVPSLTYASTEITGITLERFVINDETAGEAITRIMRDLDWQIRVDNDKNFYFEPKGHTDASIILNVGSNAVMDGNWLRNPNRLTNSCTVIGDKAKFNTNDTEVAGASQTEFFVTYKITGNVRVTVDGTEKVGGQSGSTGTFDYSVDNENKKITFESGLSGGEEVIVYYEYEVPIKITARNDESIAAYGIFPTKVTDNTLKTTSDARKLAKQIVSVAGSPAKSGQLRVNWTENIDVGETVQVIDSFNSVDQTFVVITMEKEYPLGAKILFVGVEEINLLDLDKNLSDRIKKLEAKQDNSDIVQRYLTFSDNIDVKVTSGRIRTRIKSIAGDTMIWGSDDFGVWGTAKWGSAPNISFVLGNAEAAILGESKLGSQTSEYIVKSVTNYNKVMNERFNFDIYRDSDNSVIWDTVDNEVVL